MNRAYRILPTYTGDVSGVCAALYELGGMVVMHDPSGCNSTYNTHDETRWYRRDSLIYISGVSELDAILGNDDGFVAAVCDAARTLSPRFVALVSSPVPFMNGTDFPALARLIEAETDIPSFFVPSNGMHDYVAGAGAALAALVERFTAPAAEKLPHTINLLGVTPLDFASGAGASLRRRLEENGWRILSCWGEGGRLEEIGHAGRASVNLVVSAVGRLAAERLQKRFGTPYVAGVPVDGFAARLFAAMETAETTGEHQLPCLWRGAGEGQPVTLVGEPVSMGSLAAAIARKWGRPTRVLCPLERCSGLTGADDLQMVGEEEAEQALHTAEIIVADPMYRHIAPKDSVFLELPHLAMSGRCFRKRMENILDPTLLEKWRNAL